MKSHSLIKSTAITSISMLMSSHAQSAFNKHICYSDDQNNAIMYYTTTLEAGDSTVFFDYMRIDGLDFYGGKGTMMGQGNVGEKSLDLTLTWTHTGYRDSNLVGKLKGKKIDGQWIFTLIPWNKSTQKFDSTRSVIIKNCHIKSLT